MPWNSYRYICMRGKKRAEGKTCETTLDYYFFVYYAIKLTR